MSVAVLLIAVPLVLLGAGAVWLVVVLVEREGNRRS